MSHCCKKYSKNDAEAKDNCNLALNFRGFVGKSSNLNLTSSNKIPVVLMTWKVMITVL